MELLVAYKDDPAGHNMARFLAGNMTKKKEGDVFCGRYYDLLVIPTPAISADWLEERYGYDGFVFLSKHASEAGVPALTCHSTGNFAQALYGGRQGEVAIPHPHLQKTYLQTLQQNRARFPGFEITIEATHHGPTALNKPAIFIEVGTTELQWNDVSLCNSVAALVHQVMSHPIPQYPVAVCFGGTHYSVKFTEEILEGRHALGTVVPKHALEHLDENLLSHILARNSMAEAALLDWKGLGGYKQKVFEMLRHTGLEVTRV